MRKPSQTTHVTDRLRDGIRTGAFVAGSFLPGERNLADEFGVSRGTVGTALEKLAQEQLIEQLHGRGTRVLPLINRLAIPAICVVHNLPMVTSSTGPVPYEGLLALRGVADQLKKLRLPHDDLATYLHQSERMAEIPNLIHLSEIDRLGEKYGAMIFVEASLIADQVLKFHRSGTHVVVANIEHELDVPGTRVDHRKTTDQAVWLLAAMGHRRIAYFGRVPDEYFYARAEEGYRQGLQAAGFGFDEALFVRLPGQATVSALSATKELLQLSSPPTGIVATRDYMARDVCEVIAEAGLKVGRDISVIGFDDLTWPQAEPILTTFREPAYEMGALAVDMLVDRILDPSLPTEQRDVEARLVIRRSVGPPPDAGASAADPLLASVLEAQEPKR